MKLSEHSLRNWIDTKLSIEVICEQITNSGLEVEEIKLNINNFKNIFIGEVISFKIHPYNDNLLVLKVNIGKKIINIINNKNYIQKNIKVLVACIGSEIIYNKKIISLNIKGIISEGKLCTFHDIGIFNKINKIIKLPFFAPIGIELKDFNFYKDKIIKINTTFNRTDTFGAFGIAREVAILNNLEFPKLKNIKIPINFKKDIKILINKNINYNCFGRIIKNINLKTKTPIWIKEKLRKYHINNVNIVVDIINYIFIELGQSLYTFSFLNDFDNINVCFLKSHIILKNNKDIYLNDKILILKNKNKILSLLGNIDYNLFPININENNLFLGSFFIDPNILNNSIYQFKINNKIKLNDYFVDPENQLKVIEYATYLFLKICGGYTSNITNIQSEKYFKYINREIKLYYKNIIKIIGFNICYYFIENILKKIGYTFFRKKDFWIIIPPSWRSDLLFEEDILSDIMRIYQYDKIISTPLITYNNFVKDDILENYLKRVKYTLVDLGYYEVINYSFIDPDIQKVIYPNKKFLFLQNPISKDMSCMRISLWPGLIKNLLYHQNRQYEEVCLFESGLCFFPIKQKKKFVKQNLYFSGIIGNLNYKYHWDVSAKKFDFYDLKGHVESIFDSIGYLKSIKFKKSIISGLHISNSVEIFFNNIFIGYMGELDPFLLNYFNINYSTFLFEIFWYKIHFKRLNLINKVSEFPYSKRDISIIIDEKILVEDIILFCKKQFISEIVKIYIIDIYTGNPIVKGKKSVTLTFIFQSMYKTFKDIEIDHMINDCVKKIYYKFHAILRM